MSTKLKKLDLSKSEFKANGQKYRILDKIPISRYKEYKKIQPKLAFGLTFEELYKNCHKGFSYLNSPKPEPAMAAIIFHNIMNGIKDITDESREEPALMICSLIVVREGEDIGKWDENLAKEKIADWAAEGYEIDGFFHLALTSLRGFRETFTKYINQIQVEEESQQKS